MFKREFFTVLVEFCYYSILRKVDIRNLLRFIQIQDLGQFILIQDTTHPQILFNEHTTKVFGSGNKLKCKNVLLVRMIAVAGAQTANKSDQVFSS
jgi:hypothetical protein